MGKVNFDLSADAYIKLDSLKKIVARMEAVGMAGISVNIAIRSEGKTFQSKNGKDIYQDTTLYIKAEPDSGKQNFYFGNGRVYWLEYKTPQPEADADPFAVANADGLPF